MLCFHADIVGIKGKDGGPGRTRTYDQGIHFISPFLMGVDYLITRNKNIVLLGCGTLLPVIKNALPFFYYNKNYCIKKWTVLR